MLKVGLSPVIIDLMERGFVTGLALNGAGIVHDFELAVAGQTSEDVEDGLGSGAFGMARETGEEINRAIRGGDAAGWAWARPWAATSPSARPPHLEVSLLAAAWRLGLPATVHVAVGTDIVHMHPACDPAALGRATHLDFRLLAGAGRAAGRRRLLPQRGLGRAAARGLPEGGDPGPQPRPRARGLRHRQPRLHPVLPAEHQRGAAADAGRGPRLQPHRPPRDPGARCWRRRSSKGRERETLKGKVAVVTGASAGIGKAAARGLARQGAHVVLAVRDRAKGEEVRAAIARATKHEAIELLVVDLQRQASIREAAAELCGRHPAIHILLNNAGVWLEKRHEGPDGIETTWATNVLGYHLFTHELLPALGRGAPARIVNVASELASDLDLDDVELRRRAVQRTSRLRPEQAGRSHVDVGPRPTIARASGSPPTPCTRGSWPRSCSPSREDCSGEPSRPMQASSALSPEEGADTAVWLCASPEVEGKSGGFFVERRERACRFATTLARGPCSRSASG